VLPRSDLRSAKEDVGRTQGATRPLNKHLAKERKNKKRRKEKKGVVSGPMLKGKQRKEGERRAANLTAARIGKSRENSKALFA